MYNLTVESSYPTPYASSQFLSMILLSMIGQKHTPNTTTDIKDGYDYVVVGAGSAGSVIASRLAEKHCVTVLLLEAGKPPPKVTDIPGVARSFIGTDIDWNYTTVPQLYTGAGLLNRSVAWPSGKTIGGSSVINAMLNLRGNKKNYDDWAAHGATGWNYDGVLPYFKKLENNTDAEYVRNGYHGVNGPVTVSKPEYDTELKRAVFETAKSSGYRVGDVNGPKQKGFYDIQATVRKGQRCSAAKAYLVPKGHKNNLDIVSQAFVKKIIIENSKARAVEFDFQGKSRHVRAFKEVILSAGTINSAQLLMLSGIGPQEELKKHKIRLHANLPVGKNLQDHWGTVIGFELNSTFTPLQKKLESVANINDYITSKTGPLTSVQGVSVIAFLDRKGHDSPGDYPDHQLYFWEGAMAPIQSQMRLKPDYFKSYFGPYENKPFYLCLSQIVHPKGTGKVTLRSNNPYDPPNINPMYFSHPDDLEVVVEGLKKCKQFGSSQALKKIGSKMFATAFPGCEKFVSDDDKHFRCIARSMVITLSHQTGTVKMGNPRDPSTVLDPQLRVKTIKNLRVVDASVMPSVPSGNTNVPTMMVAEKAADLIKQGITCSS
ncbi:glucose dehydrogenase [FAD, quinone]-like isoform X2 [Parasteatoda tepidariorum]|uniref:glucose dehydrogenase [FAD, quinone]-like isoform X2 n=1 Tax=Parasteatoda tepidariorum TaxID=114398 RepID=UPI000A2C0964